MKHANKSSSSIIFSLAHIFLTSFSYTGLTAVYNVCKTFGNNDSCTETAFTGDFLHANICFVSPMSRELHT